MTTGETFSIPASPEQLAEKRYRWFELCVILLITVGSSLLNSIYLLKNGRGAVPVAQDFRWIIAIFHELTGLLLLGYILSRRKLRFRDLGLGRSLRDLRSGVIVTSGSYLAYTAGYYLVYSIPTLLHSYKPSGLTAREMFGQPSLIAVPLFLLNPFFEELIVRAYLMTEVKALTGSWTLSAALSVALQFSYHLYYGWLAAIALSFQFLVFAIYYARTQRATPIIIAHGFFDIVGLIRLW